MQCKLNCHDCGALCSLKHFNAYHRPRTNPEPRQRELRRAVGAQIIHSHRITRAEIRDYVRSTAGSSHASHSGSRLPALASNHQGGLANFPVDIQNRVEQLRQTLDELEMKGILATVPIH